MPNGFSSGEAAKHADEVALLIDATGTLQNLGIAPTGIPRLEEALVLCALEDPDRRVGLVHYDRRRRAFRRLSDDERREIRNLIDTVITVGLGGRTTIRQILHAIGRNPRMSRDSDRHFAELVSSGRRRSLSYHAAKLFFRTYRLLRLAFAAFADRRRNDLSLDPKARGIVLVSNTVLLGSRLSQALRSVERAGFICHDLIPIIAPHFAVDPEHAQRFADNIEQAMRFGATILCTSQTSQEMAAEYGRNLHVSLPPLTRFPMPSILYDKASRIEAVLHATPDEPFAVYCSTIEVRKNHLMLARIWQRALTEGVRLPKLVCIGKWGWGVDALAEFLDRHPEIASSVIFTGPVSDAELIGFYRRAAFGIVPSLMEGWGYSASECLDFGVPVVVSRTPALTEATRGMMPALDANDEEGWYREIRRLAEDSGYRAELRRRIAERHRPTPVSESWTRIKDALLQYPPEACAAEQAEQQPTSACRISVVVSTRDEPAEVLPRIGRLAAQARRTGGELILVSGAPGTTCDGAHGDIRVHHLPGRSIFDCRAAAIDIASSDIVALTEDHCEHPEDWCERILENFARNPRLVLLGGAVANGSTERIDDRMNYWMTFGTFAPGQITAGHPCIAQYIVRKSVLRRPLRAGELESSVIQKFEKIPGAVHVDPQLQVSHVQSHGFWSTFAIHFHNGRATAGLSPRRIGGKNLSVPRAFRHSWSSAKAHMRRSAAAFMMGTHSRARTSAYLLLILPLVAMHASGEFIGYWRGPGTSADRLV